MNITVNTKPLGDALNLGILNSNVTRFYAKSTMAQVSVANDMLIINLEASLICSEIRLKGMPSSTDSAVLFVDSLLLKQLVATFESPTTTFEFTDSGLILHSGKSKYTLPKSIDAELMFNTPTLNTSTPIKLDKGSWKFVQDHQMYALAVSFITPVYTKAWVSEQGDVLIGDFDNSLFTHSRKSSLNRTCLLSDTIINLFTSLPEGAQLYQMENSYAVQVKTDSYEFIAEFTPKHESDLDMGSYNADMILAMMSTDGESISVKVAAIMKVLNQAHLLSSSSEDQIKLSIGDGQLAFTDRNIDCKIPVDGNVAPYELTFKTATLKSVMSNCSQDIVHIKPTLSDGQIAGITIYSDDLTTVIAGVE